ncbi:hypothetical protein Q5752_000437 [Cryptotrichosporon argae]
MDPHYRLPYFGPLEPNTPSPTRTTFDSSATFPLPTTAPSPGAYRVVLTPTIQCDKRNFPFWTIPYVLIEPQALSSTARVPMPAAALGALRALLDRITLRRPPAPLHERTVLLDAARFPLAVSRAVAAFKAAHPRVHIVVDRLRVRHDVAELLAMYRRLIEWNGTRYAPDGTEAEDETARVWERIEEGLAMPVSTKTVKRRNEWMDRHKIRGWEAGGREEWRRFNV